MSIHGIEPPIINKKCQTVQLTIKMYTQVQLLQLTENAELDQW